MKNIDLYPLTIGCPNCMIIVTGQRAIHNDVSELGFERMLAIYHNPIVHFPVCTAYFEDNILLFF